MSTSEQFPMVHLMSAPLFDSSAKVLLCFSNCWLGFGSTPKSSTDSYMRLGLILGKSCIELQYHHTFGLRHLL